MGLRCTAPTKARCETHGVVRLQVNALDAKETGIDPIERSTSASST